MARRSDLMPGYYGRLWRMDWFLVESNIIELNLRTIGWFTHPIALFTLGGFTPPQYRLSQWVLRDNLIRNIDNRSDPNKDTPNYLGLAHAIWIEGAGALVENALFQKNLIRLDTTNIPGSVGSIVYLDSGVRTFDNNSPDGKLIFGKHRITLEVAPELVTAVQVVTEDVLITSFVK